MKNLNTLALEGRITANADSRAIPNSDRNCLAFTLAVNSPQKDGDKTVDYANFIDCKYFVKGDRISGYLLKGTKVCIQGELRQDRWEDNNGQKRSRIYVLVNFLGFSERKNDGGNSAPTAAPAAEVPSVEDFADKDIPF